MWLVIMLFLGIAIGVLVTLAIRSIRSIGNLVVVDDPDDGPYLFMEIKRSSVAEIRRCKDIKLTVVDRGMHTHK